MHKYLTELLGVFFLSLTAILATTGNYGLMAPVAIGAILAGLTEVGKELSGAHFNPVVSIAMLIRGKIDRIDIVYYVIAQVLGGVLAGVIAVFLMQSSHSSIPEIVERQNAALTATIGELLGAFVWTMAALHVAMKKEVSERNGLLLGVTLTALILTFRDISGAMFNPAIAVGCMITGMNFWADLPVYIFGPLLGAGAAASVFYWIEKAPKEEYY